MKSRIGHVLWSTVVALSLAAGAVVLAAVGHPSPAAAVGPNDPFSCATTNAVSQPIGLPPGTTFWMHNGFNGTFSSQPPSTIAYGTGSGAQTGVLGTTPTPCVLNGLSYNAADGYLYAFENDEVAGGACAVNYAMVKIGRDSSGAMAITPTNRVTSAVAAAPADNCLGPATADADSAANKILLPANYYNFGATVLTDLNNFKPYIAVVSPTGGAVTNVAATFDASCVPYLQNWIGQLRAYFYRLGYLATRPGSNDGQVGPEGAFQDWSINPADGKLYAYASVDLRQSTYPTQVPADPTGTLGAPANNTQTYLGSKVAIPAYSWAPAGLASPSYTITTQPDWILKMDQSTGATTCAAAGPAASSGAINLPGSTFPNSSAANPVYQGATTTLIAGGGVELAGSGIAAPNIMELFDSEQARHYSLDLSSCTFGSATPSCTPALDPDSLPTGRSRGDAAAFAARSIVVKKTATGAGSTAFAFTTKDSSSNTSTFSLTTGASQTVLVDPLASSVVISETPTTAWTFANASCDHGTVTTSGSTVTLDLSGVAFAVTPTCTFVNTAAAMLANTGTSATPLLTLIALLALLTGAGLLRVAQVYRRPAH